MDDLMHAEIAGGGSNGFAIADCRLSIESQARARSPLRRDTRNA